MVQVSFDEISAERRIGVEVAIMTVARPTNGELGTDAEPRADELASGAIPKMSWTISGPTMRSDEPDETSRSALSAASRHRVDVRDRDRSPGVPACRRGTA